MIQPKYKLGDSMWVVGMTGTKTTCPYCLEGKITLVSRTTPSETKTTECPACYASGVITAGFDIIPQEREITKVVVVETEDPDWSGVFYNCHRQDDGIWGYINRHDMTPKDKIMSYEQCLVACELEKQRGQYE